MRSAFVLLAVLTLVGAEEAAAQAQTFRVVRDGLAAYVIGGQSNPTITLQRGLGYVFEVRTPGHPFFIKTAPVTGTGSTYDQGVTNNGTEAFDLTFVVPPDAPDTLYYICRFHSAMKGRFAIVSHTDVVGGPALGFLRVVPNPARGSVRFELAPEVRQRTVEVTDLAGRVVRRFEPTPAPSLTWEGRDDSGGTLAPGLYLVRVRTASGSSVTRRLLWLGR